MTHPNDDKLLEFVLETLEETDYLVVRAHLLECKQCRDLQQKLQNQVERLGSIDMHIDIPEPSSFPRTLRHAAAWKWAAVLAAGFLLGFLTAQLSDNAHPIPVPQRLIPIEAQTSSAGYVPCQALDLKTLHKW